MVNGKIIWESKIIDPGIDVCPSCGKELSVRKVGRRKVKTSKGCVRLRFRVKECRNEDCELYKRPIKPFLAFIVLPYMNYSTMLTVKTGEKAAEGVKYKEIDEEFKEINIPLRQVKELKERYGVICKVLAGERKKEVRERIEGNGGYIAMCDAIELKNGKKLYLVTDSTMGSLLAAEEMETEEKEEVREIWEEMIENYGKPLAIMSDDHGSQREVFKDLMLDVPWMYCHLHFLKNLGRDLLSEYKVFKKELEKIIERTKKGSQKQRESRRTRKAKSFSRSIGASLGV